MTSIVMFDISVDYYGEIILSNLMKYYKIVISQFDDNDKLLRKNTYYLNKDYNLSLEQARYIISNFLNNSRLIIKEIIELEK